MKDFTQTAEIHGFNPDLLLLGLRSGCRVTKSRRSRIGETKCCHGLARRVSGGLARGAPPASWIIIGSHFSLSSQGLMG